MEENNSSNKNFKSEDGKTRAEVQKKLIAELKTQWILLWSERFDDRVRAEGVSVNDYAILDIEKGTIIHATKDFKILTLKQILEKHRIENPERYIQSDLHIGGWNKFIKTKINDKTKKVPQAASYVSAEHNSLKKHQHRKNGGRGWLHSA